MFANINQQTFFAKIKIENSSKLNSNDYATLMITEVFEDETHTQKTINKNISIWKYLG